MLSIGFTAQIRADDLVASTGIEEVDAEFQRFIHDGKGIFLAALRTEVHYPQTEA